MPSRLSSVQFLSCFEICEGLVVRENHGGVLVLGDLMAALGIRRVE